MFKFIKSKLSRASKEKIISTINEFDSVAIKFFSRTRFLSSLYYFLFNSSFSREQQSVLKGRLKYRRSIVDSREGTTLLRRNIHRLEKGLIMRPRREVFATAFILETVKAYCNAIAQDVGSPEEVNWWGDVLSDYFNVVGSNPEIDRARAMFGDMRSTELRELSVPYLHKERITSGVSYEQLHDLFKQRRSVRWYLDKPVELGDLNRAIDIATQAPSACNRQPFQFYTALSKVKAEKIAKCAMGTAGFAENLPAVIAVVGDLSAYPSERDRHVIYIDGGLVSMQLMLALETLGLSSCPINWPDIEKRERMLDAELGLAKHQRTIMLLAVGYADPDGGIAFSRKKDSVELMKVVDQ